MNRKRQGQVFLAPASSEGSVDGLGAVFAEAFPAPTAEEVAAAVSIAEATTPVEPTEAAEPEAQATEPTAEPEASAEEQLEVKAIVEANHALVGQVDMLKEMNASLNAEKAQLQVALDAQAAELEKSAQANNALRPAAIRQVQTLAVHFNQPVASDLNEKSDAELGSICASLLSKLHASVPAGQQSKEVPSGSDGEPTPTAVPSAHESGLSDY